MRIFGSLLLLLALASPAQANEKLPIPMGTRHQYEGYINSGSKFGVHIGDTRAQARTALAAHGIDDGEESTCRPYVRSIIACRDDDKMDDYRVRHVLYDGSVWLLYADDRIIAIAWYVSPLPPMEL